ncbi:hypothetical protein CYY_003876 [Polysphondylium violaceum]|uniref:Transmembrane protein n=1 Tax=Polysphondylium violaceum TaxID=133409 RepID=A0A8J4PW48_9MYCE|nr:hypothetical protein CYY_003876 [Polysphondylium violaceum]
MIDFILGFFNKSVGTDIAPYEPATSNLKLEIPNSKEVINKSYELLDVYTTNGQIIQLILSLLLLFVVVFVFDFIIKKIAFYANKVYNGLKSFYLWLTQLQASLQRLGTKLMIGFVLFAAMYLYYTKDIALLGNLFKFELLTSMHQS